MHAPMSAALDLPRAAEGSAHALVARALADGALDLPVLPRVAHDVMLAAQDPTRGSAEVARHIERDPALSATVLRSANAAIYGGAVEIVSARQAVARLGTVEVASLAMTAAVRASVVDDGPYRGELAQWWRASLTCGLFAKEIARARRHAVDSAFMCGLLRLLGVPVVLRVLARSSERFDPAEVATVTRALATAAGMLLCEGWNLSGAVRATVAQGASTDAPPQFAEHVFTAQLGAAMAQAQAAGDLQSAVAPSAQIVALNLYPEDLERIVATGPIIARSVESLA